MSQKVKGLVNVRMIAQHVGVAPCTVSAVLNGKHHQRRINSDTARRVLEAARQLNYMPNELARGLRARQTRVVGVLFADFTNNWADRVMNGINPVFDERGYQAFVMTHRWDADREGRELQSLLQRRVDGIINVPLPGSIALYQSIAQRGTPLLFLSDTLNETPWASFVAWDSRDAVETAVNHLLSRGRRRCAMLCQDWPSVFSGRERLRVFEQTLRNAGAPVNPDWMMRVSFDSGVEAEIKRVFGQPAGQRPDALFANNDGLAFSALAALHRLGLRVPQDVAVVGMGDLPRGDDVGAGLTSMREPCEELGRLAAETMLNMLDGPQAEAPVHVLLPGVELKRRRSTALAAVDGQHAAT